LVKYEPLLEIARLDSETDDLLLQISLEKEKPLKMQADITEEENMLGKKRALLKKIKLRNKASETSHTQIQDRIKHIHMNMKTPGLAPKAYVAYESELENLEGENKKVEEEIFSDMQKIELLQKDIEKSAKVLEGRLKHLEEVKARSKEAVTALVKEKDNVLTARMQLVSKLSADEIAPYDRLRSSKKKKVLYATDTPACTACGMALPQSFVKQLAAGAEADNCPTCGMLVYWTGGEIL